jgi:hypothetical protein
LCLRIDLLCPVLLLVYRRKVPELSSYRNKKKSELVWLRARNSQDMGVDELACLVCGRLLECRGFGLGSSLLWVALAIFCSGAVSRDALVLYRRKRKQTLWFSIVRKKRSYFGNRFKAG